MDEAILHDQSWWAAENSAQALADAIDRATALDLAAVGVATSQRVHERFGWKTVFERLLCIFRCRETHTVIVASKHNHLPCLGVLLIGSENSLAFEHVGERVVFARNRLFDTTGSGGLNVFDTAPTLSAVPTAPAQIGTSVAAGSPPAYDAVAATDQTLFWFTRPGADELIALDENTRFGTSATFTALILVPGGSHPPGAEMVSYLPGAPGPGRRGTRLGRGPGPRRDGGAGSGCPARFR